jgi:hypothetical protein
MNTLNASKFLSDSEFNQHLAILNNIRKSPGHITQISRLENHHLMTIERRKYDSKHIKEEREKKLLHENKK